MTTIDHAADAGSKPIEMTPAQHNALVRKHTQDDQGMTLQQFLESAHPTFGCDNAITVKWCNMWLAIETDGYTHS
jgi:hypothetical protein